MIPNDELQQQIALLLRRSKQLEQRSRRLDAESVRQTHHLSTLLAHSKHLINDFDHRYGLVTQQDHNNNRTPHQPADLAAPLPAAGGALHKAYTKPLRSHHTSSP
jgi:hypothetical protein